MSEQQFIVDILYYAIMTPIEKISVGKSYMTYREVVDLLNYQDRLIEEQHDEIINWTKKYVGIKKENEQLRKELKEIKENPINYF